MQVFILHIPKTGIGTLEKSFAPRFEAVAPRYSWTQNPGLLNVQFQDFDLITGHYPFQFAERLRDPVIMTMFRDPVARVLSHWSYVHEYGYHFDPAYTDWTKAHTLEDWLANDYSQHAANNLMTRFMVDRIHDRLPEAMHNLEQVDYIGFLDDWNGLQETADRFLEYVDRDKVKVEGHYNANNNPIGLSDLKPETLADIQERNALDMLLYQRARELMQERKAVRV
jgi:hypothetical protein